MNISGQAFDTLGALLHLLADPKAYEAQLAELRKNIDDNKKYVELIAPAGEIMNMLEAQRVATADANKRLDDAKLQAKKIVDAAAKHGDEILAKAGADAAAVCAQAQAVLDAAKADQEEAKQGKAAAADAKRAASAHRTETGKLAKLREEVAAEKAAATQAREAAEALRAELAAKLDKLRDL
jgi:hypothetical protein